MKIPSFIFLAAALLSCCRLLHLTVLTKAEVSGPQRSSRGLTRALRFQARSSWDLGLMPRLRGGIDEDLGANQRWSSMSRVYGPFCAFPEEGRSSQMDPEEHKPHDDDDSDYVDEEEDEEDFVLHLPTCDAVSSDEECPEHELGPSEDISSFYGSGPQWNSRVPEDGAQKDAMAASRRLRRAAFDSLIIPWNISTESLRDSFPTMIRQLKRIDSTITKDDLAAALFKFVMCRAQVAHVKERGVTHGWNVSHPPPTSVSGLTPPGSPDDVTMLE